MTEARVTKCRSLGLGLTLLATLILNTLIATTPSFITSTHAGSFEILVSKPTIELDFISFPLDTPTKAPLSKIRHKLISSKYVGNSVVTNAKNLGYSGTIFLGNNPPQSFEVVFDTGSDMIVITSDECQGAHCDEMAHYTCTSCTKTPYSYNISYGDGTWGSGPIVADTVSIGGLIIRGQQILDITQSGLDLSSYGPGISGLVGLMPNSPVLNAVPPLATISKDNLLDMNVFSVYLAPSLKQNQGGSFLFGGIDSTKFVGPLNYAPVSTASGIREGMWYVDADNAYAGDTPVKGYTKSPWLFDTGTSFIAVPTSFAAAFHASIPGSAYSTTDGIYILPCQGTKSFGVSFNGIKYEVPYSDYVTAAGGGSSLCVSLVMPLGNYEMYILGDPFLRQVYTVYDFTPGASRIGIAQVNVKNASLGNEGLSGEPVPGGAVITPKKPSSGWRRYRAASTRLFSPVMVSTVVALYVAFLG
ncbi:acid protease [Linnemannia elongata AG-77]|uniref:Acid protease n=1 Tax=Linnemannia elongata AG-77 TaxID=1314771 RepID=A0A197JL40_9FUNG|nr:acid protease [Linnemannia elongata AG-77]